MRVRTWSFLLCLVASSTGCTHTFLHKNAIRQSGTLTDLMYGQVLDNLAMFSCEPDTLPHFAVVGDGTTQLSDQGSTGTGLAWNPRTLTGTTLSLSANRNLMENWKLSPVMSPGRLQRLRAAFHYLVQPTSFQIRYVTKTPDAMCPEDLAPAVVVQTSDGSRFLSEMVAMQLLPDPVLSLVKEDRTSPKPTVAVTVKPEGIYFQYKDATDASQQAINKEAADTAAKCYSARLQESIEVNFPTGWYCAGCRGEMPRGCTFSGGYGKQRAWVVDGGVDALARFTTTALVLATQDPTKPSEDLVTIEQKFPDGQKVTWTAKKSKVRLSLPNEIDPTKPTSEVAARYFESAQQYVSAFDGAQFTKRQLDLPTVQQSLQLLEEQKATKTFTDENTEKLDKAIYFLRRIRDTLDSTPFESEPPSAPSPFDRPGNSPFSKGSGGAEFVPQLVP